jgi:hypothetical protein
MRAAASLAMIAVSRLTCARRAARHPQEAVMKHIVYVGYDKGPDAEMVRRYAEERGYLLRCVGLQSNVFETATVIKESSMAVIWNGLQGIGLQATQICRRRGIPVCFIEWGLLPQDTTFFVDPQGFCANSILARDVSWVTAEDMASLQRIRAGLQKRYPVESEGHVLAVLQIENDTQILYFSPYRTMREFVADVEAMYPTAAILVRPHPRSKARRVFERAEVDASGEFLAAAARAAVVVGITSTCLYEAGILGVPVVALGDHPLRLQPTRLHDRVLAGALALSMDRSFGTFAATLERFRIQPL